nr:hypothetical protein [Actinomycetota bacterium]
MGSQPGIAGSQFPGEDAQARRIKDLERMVQQFAAASAHATAGISAALKSGDVVRRPLIGARVGSGSGVVLPDAEYFNATHSLEDEMDAPIDVVNWYRGIGPTSAEEFTSTVTPELAAYPNRRVLYVFEIHRSNSQFNKDFYAKTGIYPHVVETLLAIKNSGYADRVYIAPFHEGNGGGGTPGNIGSYPWHAYDTDEEMFDGYM